MQKGENDIEIRRCAFQIVAFGFVIVVGENTGHGGLPWLVSPPASDKNDIEIRRCVDVYIYKMKEDVLQNWEKKSAQNQKKYTNFLKRADKNKVLKALPLLHEEAFEKIDCLKCANCCRNYSPRFKTPDIKRISKHLKMKESDFIETYLRLDNDGDYVAKQAPCPFLGEDNYCNIYENRPSDCHRFPYTDEDVFLKRPAITLKNSTFCPIVYYVLEKLDK